MTYCWLSEAIFTCKWCHRRCISIVSKTWFSPAYIWLLTKIQILSLQIPFSPGLYLAPSVYVGPGFCLKFYGIRGAVKQKLGSCWNFPKIPTVKSKLQFTVRWPLHICFEQCFLHAELISIKLSHVHVVICLMCTAFSVVHFHSFYSASA